MMVKCVETVNKSVCVWAFVRFMLEVSFFDSLAVNSLGIYFQSNMVSCLHRTRWLYFDISTQGVRLWLYEIRIRCFFSLVYLQETICYHQANEFLPSLCCLFQFPKLLPNPLVHLLVRSLHRCYLHLLFRLISKDFPL